MGAILGIIFMLVFRNIAGSTAYNIFYVLHPGHVILSALVTASMFELHRSGGMKKRYRLPVLLLVGYIGSVGIATVSDSIIPYLGELLLDMPNREVHIGFLEEWWIVNPLALGGIALAYFRPSTRFPHMGHVLLSTWASIFHVYMAKGQIMGFFSYLIVFVFLFIAVWIPCCVSDIVFPLLFVKNGKCGCPHTH